MADVPIGNRMAVCVNHPIRKSPYTYPKTEEVQLPLAALEQNPNAPKSALGVSRNVMGRRRRAESETRRLGGVGVSVGRCEGEGHGSCCAR